MARARLNVVDSSAWLEYFADGPGATHFAAAIEAVGTLLVPTICLLEVFKVVVRERDENDALQAAALMQQGRLVDLDPPLALSAAQIGVAHRLPLADSIVYATAQAFGAVLWTQDSDFEALPDVRYFNKTVR
jgi:predicted nucleic acid-binding protein